MPVQSVSLNKIAFRGETAAPAETKGTPANIKKPADNNGIDKKKIGLALGGLAVAGVAAVAILKGKKVPSKLSIDEFKKIGKFDKGFATAKNKPFSGIINVVNKEGNYALQYDKGVLKESVLFKEMVFPEFGQNEPKLTAVLKRVYSDGDDGKKVEYILRNPFHTICGGEEWGKFGSLTVSSDKTSVVKECTDMSTGEVLYEAVSKQKDGSWIKA